MIHSPSVEKSFRSRLRSGYSWALVVAVSLAAGCHGGPVEVIAELSQASGLSADLRSQFNKAADASNRAVMADTDAASVGFAHEAALDFTALEHDAAALTPLLIKLGVSEESTLLGQFGERYHAYRKVEDEVLALAVENTNLKAQALSFGPAREAADRFKSVLTALVPKLSATDRCRADAQVASAVIAVRELQTLYAPHIAAAGDAAMASIEQNIVTLEGTATSALHDLNGLVEASGLSAAQAALEQLKTIDAQIVKLSRQNSNVRSLDLSLRVTPALSAACDDSLRSLQQALANEGSKATR